MATLVGTFNVNKKLNLTKIAKFNQELKDDLMAKFRLRDKKDITSRMNSRLLRIVHFQNVLYFIRIRTNP